MYRQKGFTLLEILIAIFIFSIGFLGAGALQMASIQSNQNNYYRTQAIFLANEIADQMRVNSTAARDSNAFDSVNTRTFTGTANACRNTPTGCTPNELANNTIYEWSNNFKTQNGIPPILNNGSGKVTRTPDSNNFEITVSWNERDWKGSTNSRENKTVEYSLIITL